MSIIIRKSEDFNTIVKLNNEIFPGELLDVSSGVSGWIGYDNHGQKPIGFCTASDIGYGVLFLSRCGVKRSHRGLHLQRRFIKARIKYAIKNNFKTIVTYTNRTNTISVKNLLACGFKLYEPYEWNGRDFIYLRYDFEN